MWLSLMYQVVRCVPKKVKESCFLCPGLYGLVMCNFTMSSDTCITDTKQVISPRAFDCQSEYAMSYSFFMIMMQVSQSKSD